MKFTSRLFPNIFLCDEKLFSNSFCYQRSLWKNMSASVFVETCAYVLAISLENNNYGNHRDEFRRRLWVKQHDRDAKYTNL